MIFLDSEKSIQLDDDFECSSIGEIKELKPNFFEIGFKPEILPDWFQDFLDEHFDGAGVPKEYSFCVRANNLSDTEQTITLRFLFSPAGRQYLAPHHWIKKFGAWTWADATSDDRDYVDIKINLAPKEQVWVASAPLEEPDEVVRKCIELADYFDFLTYREIGRSEQGRPIPVLETPERDLKIIIQATPQSCEPVSWGILHLAHWLTIPTHVTRELLDRIQFCLMPLTNPDGVALGMSVTNSLGQVPKFEYHLAEKGEGEAAMETQAIWNYFVEKKPDIVSEIHAHYRWDTMWRTIGWDDSEAIPENLREKNEHLITAVKAAYPDSHPETDYSVIDYRKPSHDVYGTREMNGIDILGFWLQAIPETIESHNADVREFIQTIAWALMNE